MAEEFSSRSESKTHESFDDSRQPLLASLMSNKTVLIAASWLFLSACILPGQTATSGMPFQQNNSLNLAVGSGVSFIFYDVPVGKRLVLDYVSAWADVSAGERLRFVIQTTVGSNSVDYRLVPSSIDNGDGTVSLTANQSMRICADGGTRVVLQIFRDKPNSSSKAGFAFSGSLVAM